MIYAKVDIQQKAALDVEMNTATDAKWYRRLKIIDLSGWTSLRFVDTEIRYRCHLTEVTDGKIVHTGVQG